MKPLLSPRTTASRATCICKTFTLRDGAKLEMMWCDIKDYNDRFTTNLPMTLQAKEIWTSIHLQSCYRHLGFSVFLSFGTLTWNERRMNGSVVGSCAHCRSSLSTDLLLMFTSDLAACSQHTNCTKLNSQFANSSSRTTVWTAAFDYVFWELNEH